MLRHSAQPITSRIPGIRFAGRAARGLVHWLRSVAGRSFCGGALAALFGVFFCHQMFARFGGGLMTSSGAAAAVAVGLLASAVGSRGRQSRIVLVVAALVPAVWVLAVGWLADCVQQACGTFAFDTLASPWGQFAAAFAAGLLLLGVPIACAARLALGNRGLDGFWSCFGASLGCLIAAYVLAPTMGLEWMGRLAIAVTVAWVAVSVIRGWSTNSSAASTADEIGSVATPDRAAAFGFARIVLGSIAVGVTAGALVRLVQQLMPATEAVEWTSTAGFLFAAAATWGIVRANTDMRRFPLAAQIALVAALLCALPLVLFKPLTDLFLAATATLSNVPVLFLVRGAVAAAALLGAGALWAAVVGGESGVTMRGTNRHPALLLSAAPAFLAGLIAARWLMLTGTPLPWLVAAGALLPARWAALTALRGATGRGWVLPGAVWTAAAALFAVGLLTQTYDAARSSRLLFSTNVFLAWRNSTESRLLPFLDDSRLLATREGETGTYTAWKQRGMQLALRQSGIPCGTFCPRPEIGPQFSGEIVPCVLPLVLHEAPRHMLILGLGSGSGLAACLDFPIENVTCVEGDRARIELLERDFWPATNPDPRDDNRVRIACVEPNLAVQARGGRYDVVYADLGQSGVAQGTSHYTREFYAAAARQLSADGIFAQRFQQIDFGPWPLESLLATLRSVFSHVAAIEVAPGEVALVATQSEKGLSRPHLLERFQAPQVRRSLAHLGWDWSVALNLAAYAGADCVALSKGAPLNTAANGLFAFRLPQETMRWASKNEELGGALSPHAGRIAQWPGVDGNSAELLRRLTDVMRERDLMTSYTDQPWVYRKLLQEELTKHPHTTIENGDEGFERRLDPVDQQRVDYFTALGQVASAGRPTLESLRRVEEFAEPFDPVLTYFLHHELAAFYARSEAAGSMAQLQHRLYTVYYSDPRDHSVRDVVDALDILDHEAKLLPADQRWDYLNALLGFLEMRWMNRGFGKPASPEIVLNDLERSIDAIESTLNLMDRLQPTVGIAEADWSARRAVLDRQLTRPLRSYRTELIPIYQKEAEKTASSDAVQPTEPPPSAN
jgi:hypothetical protein